MFGVNHNNMCRVKDEIKTLTNTIQSNLKKTVIFVLLCMVAIFVYLVLFVVPYTPSSFIYSFMKINENTLGLMNVSVTLILVVLTAIYVLLTKQIVLESRKENKIAYIEKRLEKLYYPLQDFIKSPTVFNLYYHDEIDEASSLESYNKEEAEKDGSIYTRPADSILYDCDVQNNSVQRYDLESIIPYRYLATKELSEQLKLVLNDFRDINPIEIASSDPGFKIRIDKIEEIIINDIKSLIEEHAELL